MDTPNPQRHASTATGKVGGDHAILPKRSQKARVALVFLVLTAIAGIVSLTTQDPSLQTSGRILTFVFGLITFVTGALSIVGRVRN